jgi:hypothetical protein
MPRLPRHRHTIAFSSMLEPTPYCMAESLYMQLAIIPRIIEDQPRSHDRHPRSHRSLARWCSHQPSRVPPSMPSSNHCSKPNWLARLLSRLLDPRVVSPSRCPLKIYQNLDSPMERPIVGLPHYYYYYLGQHSSGLDSPQRCSTHAGRQIRRHRPKETYTVSYHTTPSTPLRNHGHSPRLFL